VASFAMLELWHKTPIDLGLKPDQVDPAWQEAMFLIKSGLVKSGVEAQRETHRQR
jgi:hypothetical protein